MSSMLELILGKNFYGFSPFWCTYFMHMDILGVSHCIVDDKILENLNQKLKSEAFFYGYPMGGSEYPLAQCSYLLL